MTAAVKVTINVRPVGQSFGCEGLVRSRRTRRVLATTEIFPYGMDGRAYAAALRLAEDAGYDIIIPNEEFRVDV